ncbi:hypothetical protein V6N11_035744 [Hibiscus sabdariffa]|uniref:RNase H type-1 domain-containing protein n=1 Tax=Hibiscus sabdariffa TaxID=183260 RepID=A0ABR2R8M4_9ROSI
MVEANNTLMHAALDSLKSAIAPPLPRASNAPYKGNMRPSPVWKVIAKLDVLPKDYLAASGPSGSTPALHPLSWSPPPVGTVTLNVDGSFHCAGGAGIGVVARDSSGQVLCGLARHIDDLSEAEFVEHAALLAGLHLALDRGWTSVQIEMDSAQTVNQLCQPSSCDLSIFGPSLEPARAILSVHPHIRLPSGSYPCLLGFIQ